MAHKGGDGMDKGGRKLRWTWENEIISFFLRESEFSNQISDFFSLLLFGKRYNRYNSRYNSD